MRIGRQQAERDRGVGLAAGRGIHQPVGHRRDRGRAVTGERGVAGLDGRRRRTGQQVGHGVGARDHRSLRRGDAQRGRAGHGRGVRRRGERGHERAPPLGVVGVERTESPRVTPVSGDRGSQPSPGDQLDRDPHHRGPGPHRRAHPEVRGQLDEHVEDVGDGDGAHGHRAPAHPAAGREDELELAVGAGHRLGRGPEPAGLGAPAREPRTAGQLLHHEGRLDVRVPGSEQHRERVVGLCRDLGSHDRRHRRATLPAPDGDPGPPDPPTTRAGPS
ncbi:MAG: hypothetical protein U5R31_05030 [Acidimicrobiia bacterium]|nr:hypothetical protein [Acidimicrobiia bacterium]